MLQPEVLGGRPGTVSGDELGGRTGLVLRRRAANARSRRTLRIAATVIVRIPRTRAVTVNHAAGAPVTTEVILLPGPFCVPYPLLLDGCAPGIRAPDIDGLVVASSEVVPDLVELEGAVPRLTPFLR